MQTAAAGVKMDIKGEAKAVRSSLLPATKNQSKRDLYIKIFKEEFIREMQFIWDVANDRAKPKDNFTSKIVALLKDPPVSIP